MPYAIFAIFAIGFVVLFFRGEQTRGLAGLCLLVAAVAISFAPIRTTVSSDAKEGNNSLGRSPTTPPDLPYVTPSPSGHVGAVLTVARTNAPVWGFKDRAGLETYEATLALSTDRAENFVEDYEREGVAEDLRDERVRVVIRDESDPNNVTCQVTTSSGDDYWIQCDSLEIEP